MTQPFNFSFGNSPSDQLTALGILPVLISPVLLRVSYVQDCQPGMHQVLFPPSRLSSSRFPENWEELLSLSLISSLEPSCLFSPAPSLFPLSWGSSLLLSLWLFSFSVSSPHSISSIAPPMSAGKLDVAKSSMAICR